MEEIVPSALVLGCNTPVGLNPLSDWIEEKTGHAPDFFMSSWDDVSCNYLDPYDEYCNSYGFGDNFGNVHGNGFGDGCGYGFTADGNGDGVDCRYGDGQGNGYGYGDDCGVSYGDGCGGGRGDGNW